MKLYRWSDLPDFMRTEQVRPYWKALSRKRGQLVLKRVFDIVVAAVLLCLLAIPMGIIALLIRHDSKGPVFYRQERVTSYGRHFKIHKFRTMVSDAERLGTAVTVHNDSRITRMGARLRGHRLDELPQLIDVLTGNMSFVGTRPEAVKYVDAYAKEYYATLLLPAGITSECSIRYKDEEKLLDGAEDPDRVYLEQVLPEKMKWNLYSIRHFSFLEELKTMGRTVRAVLGKDYDGEVPEVRMQARKAADPARTPNAEEMRANVRPEMEPPAVRIVTAGIIAYNEHRYLPDVLYDLRSQTYPHEWIEVVLVDGESTDDTLQIMLDFQKQYGAEFYDVKVVPNPKRTQPSGWNVVIGAYTGDALIRIDAHARLPEDFIERSVSCLNAGEDVCGGPRENIIDEDTPWKRTLLCAEQSMFGSGFASYRQDTRKIRYVDSLFHAAYRRAVIERAGEFREDLIRTEDNEYHYRIRQAGYRICYDPRIRSYYQTRNSLLGMLKQKFGNGCWIGRTLYACPGCISLFHLVPFAFVCMVILTLVLLCFGIGWPAAILWILYGAANLSMTAMAVFQQRHKTPHLIALPFIFALLHIGYGVGTLVGLFTPGKVRREKDFALDEAEPAPRVRELPAEESALEDTGADDSIQRPRMRSYDPEDIDEEQTDLPVQGYDGSFLGRLRRVNFREVLQIWKLPVAAVGALFYRIKHKNLWIVCEDPKEARDNGFWFFRYVRQVHPEQEIVYAIRPDSPDYRKVTRVGKTVSYGSLQHWMLYLASTKKISSQKAGNPNAAIFYFLEVYGLLKDKRIFLQHGVIINELKWLYYDVTKVNRFICGAYPEYEFIRDTFGYPAENVVYTGICRFDGLHGPEAHPDPAHPMILIMPTWREWIADEDERLLQYEGTRRIPETNYFRTWSDFIGDERLRVLARRYGVHFVFFPHRNMQKYIRYFPAGDEYVEIADGRKYDVQALMKAASMMVTDYSSVFMDMVYMKKPVAFYQFDLERFRKGQYGEGYFHYDDNPFGPSFREKEEVLREIETQLQRKFRISAAFEEAHREYFPLYDQHNCRRVYDVVAKCR